VQTEQIVQLLIAERDRLQGAIDALQGPVKRRGRPPGSGRKKAAVASFDPTADNVPDWVKPASAKASPPKRKLSAAGRKAIAEAAKKRWALIKAGKAASPFAPKGAKKKPGKSS
jgi:hypothetical protein